MNNIKSKEIRKSLDRLSGQHTRITADLAKAFKDLEVAKADLGVAVLNNKDVASCTEDVRKIEILIQGLQQALVASQAQQQATSQDLKSAQVEEWAVQVKDLECDLAKALSELVQVLYKWHTGIEGLKSRYQDILWIKGQAGDQIAFLDVEDYWRLVWMCVQEFRALYGKIVYLRPEEVKKAGCPVKLY